MNAPENDRRGAGAPAAATLRSSQMEVPRRPARRRVHPAGRPGRHPRRAHENGRARVAVTCALWLAIAQLFPVAATAAVDPLDAELDAAADPSFPDPFEETNRGVFAFNQGLDRWVVRPASTVYGWVLPQPGRDSVRRALHNLDSPAVFINQLLQGRPGDAGTTLVRFCLNSTLGLAGLADPAEHFGLPPEDADFGQTLAVWGADSGPYLVLPMVGPSTARDGFGTVVDFFLEPTTWILTPASHLYLATLEGTVAGIDTRYREDRNLDALRASSLDHYAATRNAWSQYRRAQVGLDAGSPSATVVAALTPIPAPAGGPSDGGVAVVPEEAAIAPAVAADPQGVGEGAPRPAAASATLASAVASRASKP